MFLTPPIQDLGGTGPPLLLTPANGFPPATYLPAFRPLQDRYRLLALPPRALWPGIGSPPEEPGSLRPLADDILRALDHHRIEPALAIGHSFGAVALLLAAALEPDRFMGLALLDVTVMTRTRMAQVATLSPPGLEGRTPLIRGALSRRQQFGSLEEAFDYWRDKPLFADWSDEALQCYTEAALAPDGDGYSLRWSGAWEAWYYRSFHTTTWDAVDRLPRDLPLLVVRGGTSHTFSAEAAVELQKAAPNAQVVTLPNQGHLFPQAAPGLTLETVEPWLTRMSRS
ncbi:MAG: alpha/beta hydrolase [Gemmatimonadota bacterium]